ncbi:MAG: tetraacyldisaccharide 4'-kinase [Candidatus Omnitrophica bacterium]|nr:tetraacyldisaccharide 4'-kinase [Candidatus Omnitrophota bacterium]
MKVLILFSFIYYIAAALRNFFYRRGIFKQCALGAKVISVGNITWGGTGKTPAVASIAKALLKEGKKPAILLRGYGRDEIKLFSRLVPKVPIMAGKDRVKTGRQAIQGHSVDTLLLDDGFQYRRLRRDLDIVCVDATNAFGNGLVIPAGSMREGLDGLKRADVFLITRADLVQDTNALTKRLREINPKAVIAKSIHRPAHFYRLSDEQLVDIEILKNKDIVLLSAVGNPGSFEKTILKIGLKFKRHFIFRDHHWYTKRDLEKIGDYCTKNNINAIISTEKDAVKLSRFTIHDSRFTILHIDLNIIDNEQGFYNRLSGIYNS